jgi:mRNA deadenylase 3'-5' endonuclease subunit Ccr4
MSLSFRLTSYNVLAESYATKKLYPRVDPELMRWSRRAPVIVARVVALAPDIACLQEVDATAWPGLEAAFAAQGWNGVFAAKAAGRPDGCALLYREGALRLVASEALHYDDGDDGAAASGHLSLIATFETVTGPVRIANTHLRWQAATARAEAHIGFRQARELLDRCDAMTPPAFATVVCGDLNAPPESDIASLFRARGFSDAYEPEPQPTCSPHRRATRIDFIFSTSSLRATPEPIPAIDGDTLLPSAAEPSDHLPITVRLAAAPASLS